MLLKFTRVTGIPNDACSGNRYGSLNNEISLYNEEPCVKLSVTEGEQNVSSLQFHICRLIEVSLV